MTFDNDVKRIQERMLAQFGRHVDTLIRDCLGVVVEPETSALTYESLRRAADRLTTTIHCQAKHADGVRAAVKDRPWITVHTNPYMSENLLLILTPKPDPWEVPDVQVVEIAVEGDA